MREKVFYDLSTTAGPPVFMKAIVQFISRYWFLIVVGILFAILMGMAVLA